MLVYTFVALPFGQSGFCCFSFSLFWEVLAQAETEEMPVMDGFLLDRYHHHQHWPCSLLKIEKNFERPPPTLKVINFQLLSSSGAEKEDKAWSAAFPSFFVVCGLCILCAVISFSGHLARRLVRSPLFYFCTKAAILCNVQRYVVCVFALGYLYITLKTESGGAVSCRCDSLRQTVFCTHISFYLKRWEEYICSFE